MKKILLIFIIKLLFILFSFSDETSDINNNIIKTLKGDINRKPTSIEYNLMLDDMPVICNLKTVFNKNTINIIIGNKEYTGRIFEIEGIFMPDFYDVKLYIEDEVIEGEIKVIRNQFKKVYRTDIFELNIGRQVIKWYIKEDSKKRTYTLEFNDKKIFGEALKKGKITIYEFNFGGNNIKGSLEKKIKEETINCTVNGCTEDELFIFLFMLFYQELVDMEALRSEDER